MIKRESQQLSKKKGSHHISALIANDIKGILILYSICTIFTGLASPYRM
jgi:hypothetical protein